MKLCKKEYLCEEGKDRGRCSNRKKYLKVMGVHWTAEPNITKLSNLCFLYPA